MKSVLILVALTFFFCSTVSSFQDGGGKSTKKQPDTKKTSGTTSAYTTPSGPDTLKFCGIWLYNGAGKFMESSKDYLKIGQAGAGRFKLTKGFEYPKGKISWADGIAVRNADGIYLRPKNGNLMGRFVSPNFYATHGAEFTYEITCELKSSGKLVYSVWSSIRGETERREAAKISN